MAWWSCGVPAGGRLELPPERCALLEKSYVKMYDRVRGMMADAYDEHVAFEERLARLSKQRPGMDQYIPKRRNQLSLYTEQELKRWFESSGYTMADLNKTDERQAARETRSAQCARLQAAPRFAYGLRYPSPFSCMDTPVTPRAAHGATDDVTNRPYGSLSAAGQLCRLAQKRPILSPPSPLAPVQAACM